MGWYLQTSSSSGSSPASSSASSSATTRPTHPLRNALLSYPEEAILSTTLCQPGVNMAAATWQEQARGQAAGRGGQGLGARPGEELLSPVFPRDAMAQREGRDELGACGGAQGFQAHWRWAGVVVSVPSAVLERVNGFPEDASLGLLACVL